MAKSPYQPALSRSPTMAAAGDPEQGKLQRLRNEGEAEVEVEDVGAREEPSERAPLHELAAEESAGAVERPVGVGVEAAALEDDEAGVDAATAERLDVRPRHPGDVHGAVGDAQRERVEGRAGAWSAAAAAGSSHASGTPASPSARGGRLRCSCPVGGWGLGMENAPRDDCAPRPSISVRCTPVTPACPTRPGRSSGAPSAPAAPERAKRPAPRPSPRPARASRPGTKGSGPPGTRSSRSGDSPRSRARPRAGC